MLKQYSRHPKIGIRPVVDGRRNLGYEGICAQTKRAAALAGELIHSHLRYTDGTAVECVVYPEPIYGAAGADKCARLFAKNNVGAVLSVSTCWCFVTEVFSIDPLQPQAIWGINGTERPGAVFLSAMLAAHNQMGMPAFQIYGRDVQGKDDDSIPADVTEKLLRWAKAAVAVAELRGRSYLAVGTTSMGIAGCTGHEKVLQHYLGLLTEHIDMCEIQRRIEQGIFDKEEYARAIAWVRANCPEGKDWNPESIMLSRERKDEIWEYNVKMTMILRDLMVGNPKLAELGFEEEADGHNALAAGFQGQRQWTDFRPNGDFPETILNSSFDWNGIREPYIVATENDCLNGVTMLLMHLLTGTAQGFSDVRTFWSPEAIREATGYTSEGTAAKGFIHLINSGATALDATGEQSYDGLTPTMKPFWDITSEEAENCLKATTWGAADQMMFRGGGFSSTFYTKAGMPMTMARISVIDGIGPIMQIAEGYSVRLPREVFDVIDARTNPTWPSTLFVPNTENSPFDDVYSFMAAWSANHGAFCSGHVGADLITLASMLRIPVTLHNVAPEKIFRPSVWQVLGSACPEAADMLACKNYGPLYR